jgi:hypothetical protein
MKEMITEQGKTGFHSITNHIAIGADDGEFRSTITILKGLVADCAYLCSFAA